MQQISLAQTEEYSNTGNYFSNADEGGCSPSAAITRDIEINLLGRLTYELDPVTPVSQTGKETGYEICIGALTGSNNFEIRAMQTNGQGGVKPVAQSCIITLNRSGISNESDNC